MSADEIRPKVALLLSLLLHAAACVAVLLVGTQLSKPSSRLPAIDVWSGETFEISGVVGREAEHAVTAAPATPEPVPTPESSEAREAAGKVASVERTVEKEVEPEYEDSWLGEPGELAGAEEEEPPPASLPAPRPKAEPAEPGLLEKVFAYEPPSGVEEDATESEREGEPKTMGSSDDPGAPRNLERAFTRAIPAANTRDKAWSLLPVGDAGKAWVTLTVDEAGTIAKVEPRRPLEPYFERLIERTVMALRGGRFVLTSSSRGEQTFELNLVISERPFEQGPLELGFDPPRPPVPGRAYFQLDSGRFVEVFVGVE